MANGIAQHVRQFRKLTFQLLRILTIINTFTLNALLVRLLMVWRVEIQQNKEQLKYGLLQIKMEIIFIQLKMV